MRSSEEMAYAMYLADYNATDTQLGRSLLSWDELEYGEQQTYLRHVNAIMEYLFEYGRISAYLSYDHLETLKAEYRAYLASKNKEEL